MGIIKTTFSNNIDAAGKLNAVLGGDFINSVNLLSASLDDPIAVFEELKRGMDASGKSFNELDNGMKRVIADAAGLSVQQAGKLFSQDINTATAAMNREMKAAGTKIWSASTSYSQTGYPANGMFWPVNAGSPGARLRLLTP